MIFHYILESHSELSGSFSHERIIGVQHWGQFRRPCAQSVSQFIPKVFSWVISPFRPLKYFHTFLGKVCLMDLTRALSWWDMLEPISPSDGNSTSSSCVCPTSWQKFWENLYMAGCPYTFGFILYHADYAILLQIYINSRHILPTRLAREESRSSDTSLPGCWTLGGMPWLGEATVGFRIPPKTSSLQECKDKGKWEERDQKEEIKKEKIKDQPH